MTDAKDDAQSLTETQTPADATQIQDETRIQDQTIQDETQDADAVETDPRKRFRAALDAKNASPGTHPGSMAEGNNALKSSNGKRQRQFRRKSGG